MISPRLVKLLLAAMVIRATAFSALHPIRFSFRVVAEQQRRGGHSRRMANGEEIQGENPLKGMEITSALARIDQQWQIQQQQAPGQSRWTKLVLPKDENDTGEEVMEDPTFSPSLKDEDVVYLLEPSNTFSSTPSCLIVFVGGAGLGQFPQIAYSEFLTRLSDKLNAAILAAPYTVGLDHFELAKQTGDRLRRAILFCQDDPKRQYPGNLPTFALSHSLGSKLQTIYVAATAQQYRGMGFISYNNFGFGKTIQMARTFAEQLRGSYGFDAKTMGKSDEAFDMIFGLAETVLGAVGLEFSPSASDTDRLVSMKFDDELQRKTRLFAMDEDELDSSAAFVQSCDGAGPSTSGVTGTHLTPVYFKLGIDKLPEEARDMAGEVSGFQSVSFGDEGNMNELVQEVSNWILGKEPSRPAAWSESATGTTETPRLTGVDKE